MNAKYAEEDLILANDGAVFCVCVLCPLCCEVCSVAWGATSQAKQAASQLSRETEGEGWPASRLRIRHSSLPTVCTPVVWSPDPPVKSKASFDKDCQLNSDEMPPTLVLSCPHPFFFFGHYLLCFMFLPLFFFYALPCPGLGQMGKHYVASLTFYSSLCSCLSPSLPL